MTFIKQVIVVRHDLHMRKGKIAAQVAHASMKILLDRMPIEFIGKSYQRTLVEDFDSPIAQWLNGLFTKIVAQVNSEEELISIMNDASSAGLLVALIVDAGKTEFSGKPTKTCVAIGPDYADKIDKITGHLKLL